MEKKENWEIVFEDHFFRDPTDLCIDKGELKSFIQQELDKAREEGIKEYIDLLQGIEHYEGLKMVRGLVGLDKHEKRDYYNLQRRFEELSKLNNK